jgi:DNA-binding NarL/FixJ family response regulator
METVGSRLTPLENAIIEPYWASARSRMEETWEEAVAEGGTMGSDQAATYALSEEPSSLTPAPEQPSTGEHRAALTPREREIAGLVARGLTNRRIASELSISEHTAATYVGRILRKLQMTPAQSSPLGWALAFLLCCRSIATALGQCLGKR